MAQAQRKQELPPEPDYTEFRLLLERRRDAILGQTNQTQTQIGEQLEMSAGPGDEADLSVIDTSADYFLRLADNQRRELRQISEALDKMRKGTYGFCEECGNEISVERLRRLPYARLCVDCQSTLESRQRALRQANMPKL